MKIKDRIRSILAGKGKREGSKISVSSISIKYMGQVHNLPGVDFDGNEFEVKIPFSNKPEYDFIAKELKGKAVTIKNISVEKPFQIVSIEPKPPCAISFGSSTDFVIKVKAPSISYYGPMNLEFEREEESVVHLGISHISLLHNGNSVEIEDSAISTNVNAGEIIKVGVQLYRILKHKDIVESIKVSEPFEFAYTEPKLPVKLDEEDSYILEIFMKAPAFSYSGPIEIELKN
ncbi:MAG: hypothetical protein ACP5FN_02625 [Candidatus Micrarchaeia archaeon]